MSEGQVTDHVPGMKEQTQKKEERPRQGKKEVRGWTKCHFPEKVARRVRRKCIVATVGEKGLRVESRLSVNQ